MELNINMSNTEESIVGSYMSNPQRALGITIFLCNSFTLVYLFRLINKQKKDNSVYIQLAFVCSNDVGCGLLLNVSTIQTRDDVTVYVCAFSFLAVHVLLCMAQGNIFFICLQRYIFARNIQTIAIQWKRFLARTLLAVNVSLGMCVLTVDIMSTEVRLEVASTTCSGNVLKQFEALAMLVLFAVGLPTLLASDIFCALTIVKLSRSSQVLPEGESESGRNDDVSGSSTFRRSQQRAIVTIILILLAYNVSTLPYCLAVILSFIGFRTGEVFMRIMIYCILGNSFINPIVYILRIQDMRCMVKHDLLRVKRFLGQQV